MALVVGQLYHVHFGSKGEVRRWLERGEAMEVMIYFQVISIVCVLRSWQLLPALLTAVAQVPAQSIEVI